MLKRLLGLIVCLFVFFQSNPSFAADGNAQECVPQETSKEKKIESIESKIKDLNTLSGDGKDVVIEKLQTFAKGIDDGSFGAKSKDVRKILKAVDKAAEDNDLSKEEGEAISKNVDKYSRSLANSAEQFLPILILLAIVAFVIYRLPKVEDVKHSPAYLRRRVMNWLPMGLIYAFLYMGRYNLTIGKNEFADLCLMSNSDFGVIFGIGTLVYGFSFLINGPITDKYGGKLAILVGGAGSALMNLLMGLVTLEVITSQGSMGAVTQTINTVAMPLFSLFGAFRGLFGLESGDLAASPLLPSLSMLYGLNMYFQSFGAVAIVKVNAPWFHVRERGVFGAIFGILISLGVYFAYDINGLIVSFFPTQWVFFSPAVMLALFWVICLLVVKNSPQDAGYEDFDTGDASSGDTGPQKSAFDVFKMMLQNPVIMTIACIEFCSGFLRQAIMQWYIIFAKNVGIMDQFVASNWGLLLCCAGILGGMFAGVISDHVFNSRRGPVAAVLYGGMLVGSIIMCFVLGSSALGWLVIFMSLCVIGVHGMLSGTASMDFGGKKNVGIAVGIIDGFVYLGTAIMSFWFSWRLPDGDAAKDPANWIEWPIWMIPISLIGLLLATRVWNAKPKGKGAQKEPTESEPEQSAQ